MKKNVLAVALALMASIGAYAEKNTVSSPDGKLNVVVEDRDGKLYYSIDYAPLPSGFVVKNGMKMWAATSSGMRPALLLTSIMMDSWTLA